MNSDPSFIEHFNLDNSVQILTNIWSAARLLVMTGTPIQITLQRQESPWTQDHYWRMSSYPLKNDKASAHPSPSSPKCSSTWAWKKKQKHNINLLIFFSIIFQHSQWQPDKWSQIVLDCLIVERPVPYQQLWAIV